MDEQPVPNQQPKKSAALIWIIIIVLVLGGGYALARYMQKPKTEPEVETLEEETSANPAPTPTPPADTSAETKTFNVDGNNFSFSVSEIKVKKGDKVKIVFNNKVGFHDWVIDEFNARTPQIQAGQSATVEFVADKTGTFEYYCSVGQHRQMGMKGKLVVE